MQAGTLTHSKEKWILLSLALLWIALRIPHFGARYSFNLDSSNYARGIADFNVLRDQPHPPGFPLWVFSARALTPLAGGAMQGQIVLAFLICVLALAVFFLLARRLLVHSHAAAMCTLLLAYAPGIALNSSIPASSIVDLLSSSVAGYLAFLDPKRSRWRIVVCLGALGILAGFRPSGVGLLAPFVAVVVFAHWRDARRAVLAGALLALLGFLAWFVPLAHSVGGFEAYSTMLSTYFLKASHNTSVFMGGPVQRHLGMIGEGVIDYGMNICAWLVACGVTLIWRRKPIPGLWLYVLWFAPSLIMVFAIHSGRVGQCLQAFPPLLLLCALIGKPRIHTVVAGILLSLAISYFPYGQFQFSRFSNITYLFYRATPRLALDLEASQRKLDTVLRDLQGSGAPQPFVSATRKTEAPNIRTVKYDFPYVNWVLPSIAPAGRSIWIFDQNGPDVTLRANREWRRITGDQLMSLWEASP